MKRVAKEIIEPQLNKLNQVVRGHRNDFNSKGVRKVVFNSLLFTAGLFANNISGLDIKALLALGGAYKLANIVDDFSEARKIPTQVKNSDYYFLWKLGKVVGKQ